MLESTFQEKVIEMIKEMYLDDVWVFKTHDQCRVGIPDLILCFFGHFVAIELKQPKRRPRKNDLPGRDPHSPPSPMQGYNIRKINRAGGSGFTERDRCDIIIKLEKIKDSLHIFEAHK